MQEAKNYATALSLFDLLLGTFVYRPGVFPKRLGVESPETYPDSTAFWQVMRLPFARAESPAIPAQKTAPSA